MSEVETKETREFKKLGLEIKALKSPWTQPSFWFPVLIGFIGVSTAILQYSVSNIRAQSAALAAERTLFESEKKLAKLQSEFQIVQDELSDAQTARDIALSSAEKLTAELDKTRGEVEQMSKLYDVRQASLKSIVATGGEIVETLAEVVALARNRGVQDLSLEEKLKEADRVLALWFDDGTLVLEIDDPAKHISIIIAACRGYGVTLQAQVAYILATAEFETNNFEYFEEAAWLSDKWRKDNLQYYPYYGRGYVGLTWEVNYRKLGNIFGVDLVNEPERALEPELAADIIVHSMMTGLYTGHSLEDHINESTVDFRNARRIVNGVSKADVVAELAAKYLKKIKSGELPI